MMDLPWFLLLDCARKKHTSFLRFPLFLQVLNQIVYELPPEHPLSDTQPLKNHIGHTPPQVPSLVNTNLQCSLNFMARSESDLLGADLVFPSRSAPSAFLPIMLQVAAGAVLGCLMAIIVYRFFPAVHIAPGVH